LQGKLNERPDAMRVRRQTVEHMFGTLKAWMGTTHFLTRTLPKVATEMSLHVLAYNMILPLFHGHPVKRFNSLSEVNDETEDRRETDPATLQRFRSARPCERRLSSDRTCVACVTRPHGWSECDQR